MRLFVAIQLSDDMKDAIGSVQEEFKDQGVKGNYTSRENMHLTLAFIGEYGNPDEVLDAFGRRLTGKSQKAFALGLFQR
ncbi:MAG: hypothetical protein K6E85_14720 [Lachnospiraceae bacterium]|nr:hypothetical protein [Lachnospiraceae bacterium]